jgi:SpoVK/Ycf46/Vps4 family AAA+-type ATPase
MGPAASTALGILTGFILFLAMAVSGVIAVNGTNNPGITPAQASAGAGSTGEAHAVDAESPSIRSLDLNGDGRLSLAEAAGNAEIVTRFERADRNKDGRLTQAEFDRLAKVPPPKVRDPDEVKRSVRRDAATAAKAAKGG